MQCGYFEGYQKKLHGKDCSEKYQAFAGVQ
jgi:hypothetical protein